MELSQYGTGGIEMNVENVLPSDVEIDVWEVHPHLNTDYDYAIFDDHSRAIEYARDVVSKFIDDCGRNDELEMKIKQIVMTRGDFDEACCGD